MESNSPQDGKHLTPDKESSVPDGEQFDSTRKSNTLQTAKLLLFGICMGVVLSMLLYLAICLNLLSSAMLFLLVFSLIFLYFHARFVSHLPKDNFKIQIQSDGFEKPCLRPG